MNKKLKTLVMCTAMIGLCSNILSGCGKKEAASTDVKTKVEDSTAVNKTFKSDKPLEFSMLYSDSPSYPLQKDWLLFSEITKRTNVTLKLTTSPMSDYLQKRSLLISTGDAPLIMPKTYPGQEVPFIASGSILPISDYVSKMPNYMAKVKAYGAESDIKTLMQKDGKYYVLPGLHEKPVQDYSYVIRTDIFDKYGIKTPTTYDEMYKALKKIKAAEPNIIPFSDRFTGQSALNIAAPTFGATWGWNMGNGVMYTDTKTDKFVFSPTTNEFKDMLTYFSKLTKEGLLDPLSFTQSDDQAVQKFENGKSYVISGNSQSVNDYKKAMDGTIGKEKYKLLKITVPGGPKGNILAASHLENGIMFSAKAAQDPNFDSMLKFVDWLWYSDEGQELCKWGVEGTTYTKVNGVRTLTKDIAFQTLNPTGTKDLRKQFGFSGGVFAYGGSQNLFLSMLSPADVAFQTAVDKTMTILSQAPPVLFSTDEREQATMISKPLMDYVNQMSLKFMIGNQSLDKDWDKYVQDCKTKGSDKLIDLTNKVYKTTKSSIK